MYRGRRCGRELHAANWVEGLTETCEEWFKEKIDEDLDRVAKSVSWLEGSRCPCCKHTLLGLSCIEKCDGRG